MNKWIAAVVIMLAGFLGCFGATGCLRSSPTFSAPAGESAAAAMPAGIGVGSFLQDIGSATAGAVVSEHMTPFFLAGLGLVILGGATFVFGGKAAGVGLILLGVATTGTGVLFIQYPWTVLLVAVMTGVLLAIVAYDRYKVRKQLEGTEAGAKLQAEELDAFGKATGFLAQVIEAVPGGAEVKAGLRAMGPEAVAAVKKVVSPIKEEMGRAGEGIPERAAKKAEIREG